MIASWKEEILLDGFDLVGLSHFLVLTGCSGPFFAFNEFAIVQIYLLTYIVMATFKTKSFVKYDDYMTPSYAWQ